MRGWSTREMKMAMLLSHKILALEVRVLLLKLQLQGASAEEQAGAVWSFLEAKP